MPVTDVIAKEPWRRAVMPELGIILTCRTLWHWGFVENTFWKQNPIPRMPQERHDKLT